MRTTLAKTNKYLLSKELYWDLKQAADYLTISITTARRVLKKPDAKVQKIDKRGGKKNYYLITRVKLLKIDNSIRCVNCKKLFYSNGRSNKCLDCQGPRVISKGGKYKLKDKNDDPYGVMFQPQFRGRICPVDGCNNPVKTGQLKCDVCSVKGKKSSERADVGFIHDNYIYGIA